MLAVMRREQLLGNNPRGATLVAALVDVQGADVEALAALELFGREFLKPQCTAEIHLLESKRHLLSSLLAIYCPIDRVH